ncbi:MAG TPA: hypothetical protein P5234_09715 [Thermoanaerobaculaceae bacterium]|nr:hypothetical protein [Thermoanaerobaculaceae bacterium]HRS16508.1 hypothetical protein [Thermoanaerobaculaceae bacterium]
MSETLVIATHRSRVGVHRLDRRTGEAAEESLLQAVAHVPREAVDEVELAAVRLVGGHGRAPFSRR